MKRCSKCKLVKPFADFSPHKGGANGRLAQCKRCMADAAKVRWAAIPVKNRRIISLHRRQKLAPEALDKYRATQRNKYNTNPEYRRIFTNKIGASHHGITPEEYSERMSRPCEVCNRSVGRDDCKPGTGMHVDHDHSTGALRGTLCMRCNMGIGWFGDDPEKLIAAAEYILKYR